MQIFAGHAAGCCLGKNLDSKTRYPLVPNWYWHWFSCQGWGHWYDSICYFIHLYISTFLSKTRCLLWMLGAWWQGLLDARMQLCSPIANSNAGRLLWRVLKIMASLCGSLRSLSTQLYSFKGIKANCICFGKLWSKFPLDILIFHDIPIFCWCYW